MRKETVKKYYNNCWYLRDFDFLPEHLSEHPQLSSIQQHFIQNIDNRISIFYSLEDAVNASYNVRKLLGIRDFEIVLKRLYDKDKLYEMYGIAAFLMLSAFYKHKANIVRLMNGTENKISIGKK